MTTQFGNSIFDAARRCLIERHAETKVELTREATALWNRNTPSLLDGIDDLAEDYGSPGLPTEIELVDPLKVPKRRLNTGPGRIAFVHALAHIEFNAINLAWDSVYRFRSMPREFYGDWVRVAADEAEHFALLRARLLELGADYGDLPGHSGLWDMAEKTTGDLAARMAMVPRVLEARSLDVAPVMIDKLDRAGDTRTRDILKKILDEEVAHVRAGSRWFRYSCEAVGKNPDEEFFRLVEIYLKGEIKAPFNRDARLEAGFSEVELRRLGGR